MVTVYVPPPSASEVMDMMARWVARLYGVKVTVKLESPHGENNIMIDGRPAPLDTRTRSQKLTDAGFTRRPSLWAMQARDVLELIAAPMRTDGTWNRDREACRQMAAEALGRYED